MYNASDVFSKIDIFWAIIFIFAVIIFGTVVKFRWIPQSVLIFYLVSKVLICIGFSYWVILYDRDFDSRDYYLVGQQYSQMFNNLISGESTEYLTTTPFFSPFESATFRMFSLVGAMLSLTGSSFIACALIFCCFGAAGQLLIFRYLRERFPEVDTRYFYLILMHPSSSLWSSLLLKDSLGMLALGLIIYGLDSYLVNGRANKAVMLLVGLYICYCFRSYVLLTFILFAFFAFWDRKISKYAATHGGAIFPVTYVLFSATIALGVSAYYLINYGQDAVELQQNYNAGYSRLEAGSSFTNAELSLSFGGMLALPIGVVNSVFRPFPWEVNNIAQGLASIENIVALIVVVWGWGIYWFGLDRKRKRYSRMTVYGTLLVALICGAGVGLYASNLGTISRYRTPMIPFLLMGPCLALGLYREQVTSARMKWLNRTLVPSLKEASGVSSRFH